MEPNSTRAIGGSCRAAVATSVENTGLCFCGMAEDAPRPGACSSVTSPISVRLSTRTSAASLPSAPVVTIRLAATSARGVRTPCQGRTGSASPRRLATNAGKRSVAPAGSVVSNAYWWYAASVPAAPPSETGSAARVRRTRSHGVEHQMQPGGRLQPEGDRHGVLGQGAPGHRCVPVPLGESGQAVGARQQVVFDAVQRRRAQQHQRRVQDVLAGATAVHVLGGGRVDGPDRGGELLDERDDGVGRLAHARSHRREVDASRHGGGPDGRRRARGNHAQLGLRLGQSDFRGEHGGQQRVVVDQVSRSRRRPRGRQNSVVHVSC